MSHAPIALWLVLAMVAAGCAARSASVAERSDPRVTTSAGITCTEWSAAASRNAGVVPPGDQIKSTAVVKIVVHLMQADGHQGDIGEGDVRQLWHDGNIRYFFGVDGKVNEIWQPDVQARLQRVEDCVYSPKGLRFDGQDKASIFVPTTRTLPKGKAPETVRLKSPRAPMGIGLGLAFIASDLDDVVQKLTVYHAALVLVAREAPKGGADEWARIWALEDLRQSIAVLMASEKKIAGDRKRVIELSDSLTGKGAVVEQLRDDLKTIGVQLKDIADALREMRNGLDPIWQLLRRTNAWLSDSDVQRLSKIASDLLISKESLADIAKMRWTLETESVVGTNVSPSVTHVWDDLRTMQQWAPPYSDLDRKVREATQLFRAVNWRFVVFDPDAIHVVLWWSIDELAEEKIGDSKSGYSRAAARGGPALWADVSCLRLVRDSCGRLLAHELGHALTLRHVCAFPNSKELNTDGLPDCNEGTPVVVEGCRVNSKDNLMRPDYTSGYLEQCQIDQAKDEALKQFGR